MDLLTNPVKDYDWGSTTELPALLGLPPGRTMAELWLGAHPSGPSTLERGGRTYTLAEVIGADPVGELGAATVDRFGPRLPFLLKLLSASRALSLQVHPSDEQARQGYARRDPHYADASAKPEMVVALTEFSALAGMRQGPQAADLLARLGLPELGPVVAALARGDLTGALDTVLTWPRPARHGLVAAVAAAARGLGGQDFGATARLADQHPDDPAVLAPLLLRRHTLAPGQALYLPAGVLHTYLGGFAVEVMGASDNVLRAGLTGKPVDVPALLAVTDVSAQPEHVVADETGAYRPHCPQFRLHRLTGGTLRLTRALPRILLCTRGAVTAGDSITLHAGQSIFLPARHDSLTVSGEGTAYCAEPGI
ncbi:mannose-6-phosphate isomerase, class I [Catellatospora tritici]|uniref:mannose-6-phosphate isomerase, class I n=1 Tax=Catellatospora tritici TaxID=2851566 RepID=UPI001C2DA356|nr:mannose-6-phosphate isomerase, class I [Catellatospora tritici]MBV1851368.1 mannose-6-phosphate isomerase, class I [Catellatospora tritici]